jgi:hypothetical protein
LARQASAPRSGRLTRLAGGPAAVGHRDRPAVAPPITWQRRRLGSVADRGPWALHITSTAASSAWVAASASARASSDTSTSADGACSSDWPDPNLRGACHRAGAREHRRDPRPALRARPEAGRATVPQARQPERLPPR